MLFELQFINVKDRGGYEMNYSLIQAYKEADGFVEGTWIQDCTGTTLDIATKNGKSYGKGKQ